MPASIRDPVCGPGAATVSRAPPGSTEGAAPPAGLLPLFAWLSPSFPGGGLCLSHGLERAVEGGDAVEEAAVCDRIADLVVHGFGRTDAIHVIDVAGGKKIPLKCGPGITRSDLLAVNKTDLAPMVGASLEVMEADTIRMRQGRPYVFASIRNGAGVEAVARFIEQVGGPAG